MVKPTVNVLIPWTPNDGIMIYWLRIEKELKKYIKTNIIKNTRPDSINPLHFIELGLEAKKCNILHIQHNYSLFGTLFNKLNSTFAWLLYSVAGTNGPKIITTMHDIVEPSKLKFYERAYLEFMNIPIKLFSDKIIVHKENSKNQLIRQGFNEKNIVVIPHGVDDLKNVKSSKEMRKHFRLPERKTIILYGWIRKDKQYEKAIDSLTLLPDMQILIVGDERDKGYLNSLKNYVKEKGVERRVVFRKGVHTDDVFRWVACGDVAVLPYKRISASGALSDSISAHVPIIASSLPEFKEAEKTGVLKIVDVYSKKVLANAIKNLVKNSSKMKKDNLRFVAKNNRNEVAKLTKKLYEQVLK